MPGFTMLSVLTPPACIGFVLVLSLQAEGGAVWFSVTLAGR